MFIFIFLLCSVPRLGGVDFKALVQQEWDRYDVPRFMCIEGAKLRYLTDIHVLRAFHEGIFEITSGPTQRAPFPVLSKHLFKFPVFIALWNNVDHGTIQEFVLQPARRNWVVQERSAPPGSGLHVVKLRNVPENMRLFISGGVLGSDRVLSALGAHVDRVFLNMWHLPPLFASPPASRSGMQIKIFSGVSVTTASHWCAPKLHRLRAVQVRKLALKASRATDDNMIDHDLLPATPQQAEKKRLFANFLGRKSESASSNKRSAHPHGSEESKAAADVELDEEFPDYYSSDDEEGSGTAQYNGSTSHVGGASASAGAVPGRATQGARTPAQSGTEYGRGLSLDLDSGVLRSRGLIELEVAVRISYETAAMLPQVTLNNAS